MWSDRFIGLPFAEKGRDATGCDCWGLVRFVFADAQNIALPDYGEVYASTAEREEIAAALSKDHARWPWRSVPVTEARAFDVVEFARVGVLCHVGVVVEPGAMLHIEAGVASHIARFDRAPWLGRMAGVYRHAELIR